MVVDLVAGELDAVHERISSRFARAEPRARVREYVSGLVAGLERKNGWTLAERAGEVTPDGMQRLLRRADWDVDGVRDDVRDYVIAHLGDPGGVLIADETGFIKKGTRSAGVQRQYSGTAGRTENCQVGTFLAYASPRGHALIDRELYVPPSWAEDRDRCEAAGIPAGVEFTTKPRQAQAMIGRAIKAGVPFSWFTADEVYGQAKYLQAWLEDQGVFYVMAIRRSDTCTTATGEQRADALIAAAPARSWQRISVGTGAQLYIGEQIQRVNGQLVRRQTKTEASEAPLPLPDLCVAALKIRKEQQDADREQAGDAWIETGLVFTTRHGTPIEPRNFNRSFGRRIDKAEVPRITVHGTRKTCGSLLAPLEVHPRVAMQILRHSRIGVTMEIYTEIPSAATRDALKKLGRWLDT